MVVSFFLFVVRKNHIKIIMTYRLIIDSKETETVIEESGRVSISSAMKIIISPRSVVMYPILYPKRDESGDVATTRKVRSIMLGTSGSTIRFAKSA
jgi:hypothetical protein